MKQRCTNSHTSLKMSFSGICFYADFVCPHCDDSITRLAISTDGIHWKSSNKNLFSGHDAEVLVVNDTLSFVYYGPNGYFERKDCDIRLMIYHGEAEDMWRPVK